VIPNSGFSKGCNKSRRIELKTKVGNKSLKTKMNIDKFVKENNRANKNAKNLKTNKMTTKII
jgi:hypothetical protein